MLTEYQYVWTHDFVIYTATKIAAENLACPQNSSHIK